MIMGNMHIVTGFRGENHVTAADVGSFNAAIFGSGQYVLNRGSKFATTILTNNSIRVADGDLLIQGRHVRLNEGSYVDLTIENGAQGFLRNDLIVARYTKDSNSGVEDVNLVVIKGTPAASNPVDPEYTSGDIINDHVYLADMPLYRVPLDSLNVQTLVPLFEMASLQEPHASTHAKGGSDEIKLTDIGAAAASVAVTAILPISGWTNNTQTVAVPGVKANSNVIVSAAPESFTAYGEAGIYCSAQDAGQLTFVCTDTPSANITVNIVIVG